MSAHSSLPQPTGICPKCGNQLYSNLTHQCTSAGIISSDNGYVLVTPGELRPAVPPAEGSGPVDALDLARSALYGVMGYLGISVMTDEAVKSVASRIAPYLAARTVPDPEIRDVYPPEKFAAVDWAKRFCELFGINSDKWLQVVAYWFAKANAHGQADLAAITPTQPFVYRTVPDLALLEARLDEAKEWDTTAHYHISRWPELEWRKKRLAWLESELAKVRQK